MSYLKKLIAIELAYQRRLGNWEASDCEREEKAAEWAKEHYDDDLYGFTERAETILDEKR